MKAVTRETMGQAAFDAYCIEFGKYAKEKWPVWKDLQEDMQKAWIVIASAVFREVVEDPLIGAWADDIGIVAPTEEAIKEVVK
jgi:hypothetical protein